MATITKQKGIRRTTWRVQIRRKNQYDGATFTTKEHAERWARKVEREIDEGTFETSAEARKHTLGELVDRSIDTMLYRTEKDEDGNEKKIPLKKSSRDQERALLWWKEKIGDKKLSEVKPPLIVEFRDELATEKSEAGTTRKAGTVNRYLAYLSTAFTVALREWQWCHENPVRQVSKLKEPRGRVRFLSDDEREALLKACEASNDPRLYPLVVLALSTGARQGELLALRWGNVDLKRSVATIQDTKNDERRALPLHSLALALLKERKRLHRRVDTDLVFPSASGGSPFPRKPWARALADAEIEDFRFHDLRHSAASYLAMNGATLAEIAEVLGHKTLAMVKRYSHLTEQHVSSVVARMNEKIFEGMN